MVIISDTSQDRKNYFETVLFRFPVLQDSTGFLHACFIAFGFDLVSKLESIQGKIIQNGDYFRKLLSKEASFQKGYRDTKYVVELMKLTLLCDLVSIIIQWCKVKITLIIIFCQYLF